MVTLSRQCGNQGGQGGQGGGFVVYFLDSPAPILIWQKCAKKVRLLYRTIPSCQGFKQARPSLLISDEEENGGTIWLP